MRSFLTKGWVLFMLVVMGLGLVGVGYAYWTKQLEVHGVVQLNDLDVIYTSAGTDDDHVPLDAQKDSQDVATCTPDTRGDGDVVDPANGIDTDNPGCDPAARGVDPKNRYNKDIASCKVVIDQATKENMTIHVLDGYPSYYCTTWFDVQSTGSVPVKLWKVILQGNELDCANLHAKQALDLDANTEVDIEVWFTGLDCNLQLDQTDEAQGDVEIHVLDGAPQDKSVSFMLEMIWRQYNQTGP